MPSWNIHIAQTERLLASTSPEQLGIADANAFLFGNYAPDIYVGYMVPDASFRIDYRITHFSGTSLIPTPDADKFWDDYLAHHRTLTDPAPLSLLLGSWAHLVCDRFYNGHFRSFWQTCDLPLGDELRARKQADFDLFGRSLAIASHVIETPELLKAADEFGPYRILADDVRRSISVANRIVDENSRMAPICDHYQLLNDDWMHEVFGLCTERLVLWLQAWRELAASGGDVRAKSVRAEAGLPPATPDNPSWTKR